MNHKHQLCSFVGGLISSLGACRRYSQLPFQYTQCNFFCERRWIANNHNDSQPWRKRLNTRSFSSSATSSSSRPASFPSQLGTGSRCTAPVALGSVEFTDGGSTNPPPPFPSSFPPLMDGSEEGDEEVMSIPRDSALYSAYSARHQLDSRSRWNTWELARHKNQNWAGVWGKTPSKAHNSCSPPLSSSSSPSGFSPVDPSLKESPLMNKGEGAAWEGQGANTGNSEGEGDQAISFTDERRQHRTHETWYSDELINETLTDSPASKGESRSTYGLRKIPLPGVFMYQEMVSQEEEIKINEELLKVLQDPRAAYITTETRYCVHLYERELGIPNYDTLAFDMRTASPTLQRVLHRLFYVGLIPSLPNLCQVSEMIGNFAGYPLHEKPLAIGPYYGLLNLVTPTVLHMQHKTCPWFPRLYLSPRSITVITNPSLSDFKVGYKQPHQPFHEFEYHTRISKDYRIEVLFATVESDHLKSLRESILLTDYAEKHLAHHTTATTRPLLSSSSRPLSDGGAQSSVQQTPMFVPASYSSEENSSVTSTDAWIRKLRQDLQLDGQSGRKREGEISSGTQHQHQQKEEEEETSFAVPLDGHRLRQEAQRRGLVGRARSSLDFGASDMSPPYEGRESASASPSSTSMSAARARIEALKARHHFASRHVPRKGRGKGSKGGGKGAIRVTREGRNSLTSRVIPCAPPLS